MKRVVEQARRWEKFADYCLSIGYDEDAAWMYKQASMIRLLWCSGKR